MPGEHYEVQGLRKATPAVAQTSIPCTSAAFAELSAEMLRSGLALRFQAHGSSMQPLVRDGDVLLVRPVTPAQVHVGDVVLYHGAPGQVVVHRVVRRLRGRGECRFVVQGDAVPRPDGAIPAAQIYGRVAVLERDGVPFALDGPVMRLLGRLAALRAAWGLGRGRSYRLAARLLKVLPAFSKHLA